MASIVHSLVPALSHDMHKGSAGRIGVFGGSVDYTGAPYYAGSSALKVGGDLSFVMCAEEAATPIKCYGPELMVSPVYSGATLHAFETSNEHEEDAERELARVLARVELLLPRIHALVVGPGMGRSPLVLDIASQIITICRARNMPIVVDADGMFLVAQRPDLVRGYSRAVLTPNIVEFRRLRENLGVSQSDATVGDSTQARLASELLSVSRELGNITILLKGDRDLICNGVDVIASDEVGAPRRCGGLGDIVSGACAVMIHWTMNMQQKLTLRDNAETGGDDEDSLPMDPTLWAMWCASVLVKRSTLSAFSKHRRSMTAPDVLAEVGEVFDCMFPLPLELVN